MIKILIIDDNTDKLDHIVKVIRSVAELGAEEIYTASNLVGARDLLAKNSFDLLILDHCHPVLVKFADCKSLNCNYMRTNHDVSESEFFSFFAAAVMPQSRHARWKIDLFATHRVDSPRAISPLRHSL